MFLRKQKTTEKKQASSDSITDTETQKKIEEVEARVNSQCAALKKKYFTKEGELHPRYRKNPEKWRKQYGKELDLILDKAEQEMLSIMSSRQPTQEHSPDESRSSKETQLGDRNGLQEPTTQERDGTTSATQEQQPSPATPTQTQKEEKERMATLDDIEQVQDSILAAMEDLKKTLDEILDRLDIIAAAPPATTAPATKELFSGVVSLICPVCGQEQEAQVTQGRWKCPVCGQVGTYSP